MPRIASNLSTARPLRRAPFPDTVGVVLEGAISNALANTAVNAIETMAEMSVQRMQALKVRPPRRVDVHLFAERRIPGGEVGLEGQTEYSSPMQAQIRLALGQHWTVGRVVVTAHEFGHLIIGRCGLALPEKLVFSLEEYLSQREAWILLEKYLVEHETWIRLENGVESNPEETLHN